MLWPAWRWFLLIDYSNFYVDHLQFLNRNKFANWGDPGLQRRKKIKALNKGCWRSQKKYLTANRANSPSKITMTIFIVMLRRKDWLMNKPRGWSYILWLIAFQHPIQWIFYEIIYHSLQPCTYEDFKLS